MYLCFFFYHFQVKKWIELFTSLDGVFDGYSKSNVTPYMHAMAYHVPSFMRKYSGIKKFTGQGEHLKADNLSGLYTVYYSAASA